MDIVQTSQALQIALQKCHQGPPAAQGSALLSTLAGTWQVDTVNKQKIALFNEYFSSFHRGGIFLVSFFCELSLSFLIE